MSKARQNVDKLNGIVSVSDYGAVGNGVADDTAAIQAAIAANPGKVVQFFKGTFKITSTIAIPKQMAFLAEEATFLAGANVDVIRLHGGARLIGFPTIDCTQFVGWNSSAILFDGASESSSATNFRLDEETLCEVVCRGKTTGSGNGNAIFFKTVDDGVNNQWIMAVQITARVKGFDRALVMDKDGSDLIRTFITSNHIQIDASESLQTIVMTSDHPSGWSVDGNTFLIRSQSRSQANQLAIPVVLCGAQNDWNILQWDWLGGPGGTTKVCTLQAGAQLNILRTWMDPALITNSSTSRTNIFINSWTEQGLVFGEMRSIATDTVIRMHGSYLRADNQKGIEFENAAGNNEWPALTTDASDDLLLKGNSAAGDGVYINAPNSTGFVGLQINNTLGLLLDSNRHLYYPGFAGVPGAVTIRNFNTSAFNQDFTDGAGILSIKVDVPATATSNGKVGMWAADNSFAYFCTATNTWRRVAVASW